jgi:hypothetical protein
MQKETGLNSAEMLFQYSPAEIERKNTKLVKRYHAWDSFLLPQEFKFTDAMKHQDDSTIGSWASGRTVSLWHAHNVQMRTLHFNWFSYPSLISPFRRFLFLHYNRSLSLCYATRTVGVATRLRARRPSKRSSFSAGVSLFSSVRPHRLWCQHGHSLLPGNKVAGVYCWAVTSSGAEVKDVPTCTSISPYAFMSWCLIFHRLTLFLFAPWRGMGLFHEQDLVIGTLVAYGLMILNAVWPSFGYLWQHIIVQSNSFTRTEWGNEC